MKYIRSLTFASRVDEFGDRFVRLEFHAQHENARATALSSNFGFHGLEKRKSILLGIDKIELLEVLRGRSTNQFE